MLIFSSEPSTTNVRVCSPKRVFLKELHANTVQSVVCHAGLVFRVNFNDCILYSCIPKKQLYLIKYIFSYKLNKSL